MYLLVFLLSLYFIFLIYSLAPPIATESEQTTRSIEGLSILVPFKNEEENLSRLIDSFQIIDFHFPYEIIFIDDHSTDKSLSFLGDFQTISCDSEGKKFAIRKGVAAAKYPWILTLDADVIISKELIALIQACNVSRAKMMLFSLSPTRRKGLIPAFFDLEFLALQGIGIGLAEKGKPILSNGACLLFEKEAFGMADLTRTDYHIPSGDDIFGMYAIAEQYGSHTIKVASTYPAVKVDFPTSLSNLFSQRVRWIAKTVDVPEAKYQALAVFMGFIHLLPLGIFISLLSGGSKIDAVSLLFIKWVGEWILFFLITKQYRRRDLLYFLPIAQLLYPFYTFALIVSGIFQKFQYKKSPLNAAR